MFTSKKDEEINQLHLEINQLKNENKKLRERAESEEKFRLTVQSEAFIEHTELLKLKEKNQEETEFYHDEIAKLRRIIDSEKKKRLNAACANRRRNFKRYKTE